MSIVMINDRNAYTERELAHLVSIKIDESEMSYDDIYEKYKQFFINKREFEDLINFDIEFCYDHYMFIESFLGICIEDSTRVLVDDNQLSARGELNTPEEMQFVSILNFIFDRMIMIERYNKKELVCSNDFASGKEKQGLSSKEKARVVMESLNYDRTMDLACVLKNRRGYYLLEFPNDMGISGISLVKQGKTEEDKCICIYVNSAEPIGRKSFTLAHELYHIFFEASETQISYYKNKDNVEKRADEFASFFQFDYEKLLVDVKELGKSSVSEIMFDEIVDLQVINKASFIGTLTALNRLKQVTSNKSDINCIPILPEKLYKYRHPKYWIELVSLTSKKTELNKTFDKYMIPLQLEYYSYKELAFIMSCEEITSLYEFFELECC